MPDNVIAKNVPEIPGLLEYRQDEKKLYLRANKTWNLLTQEKEVKLYIDHTTKLFTLNLYRFDIVQGIRVAWVFLHPV